MIEYQNPGERDALIQAIQDGYMEVYPTNRIEEKLQALAPGSYVDLTCSPTKGVEETLDMTERMLTQGFRVVPHLAARAIRDRRHLREIMQRLDDLPVDAIFVPGGDSAEPLGDFSSAFELLREIAEYDHRFKHIGIAAHPEGHPVVDDDVMMSELIKKQSLATYIVTQMCFDAGALENWLTNIRRQGVTLPVWLGLPGEANRAALLKTSMRIGVGDSLRFLKRKSDVATQLLRHKTYTPNELLGGLAPMLVNPTFNIEGFHIFCFNLVESTERWRRRALATLEYEAATQP